MRQNAAALQVSVAPQDTGCRAGSGNMTKKIWYTYDDIHKTVRQIAEKIDRAGVCYDAMIAIGGGGFIPARILRTFLDIPI